MISITEAAASQLIDQISNVNGAIGIRAGIIGGGCSGFQYQLDFVMEKSVGDIVYEDKGVSIYVDAKSNVVLSGTTIDYKTDLLQSGFKFINPAASRTCGCGESFSC